MSGFVPVFWINLQLQAAALLLEVLRRSRPGRLRHVVQLHLSRECNCAELAVQSAAMVLHHYAPHVTLYTASQYEPGPALAISGCDRHVTVLRNNGMTSAWQRKASKVCQSWLPGWEV